MHGAASGAPADLDPSFGATGVALFALDPNGTPVSALEPDGSLLVASTITLGPDAMNRTQTSWLVRRFRPDGAIDTRFGMNGNGSVVLSFDVTFGIEGQHVTGVDVPTAVALVGDGRFVVAGRSIGHCAPPQGCELALIMARFEHDGRLDEAFGNAGKVIGTHWADAVAVQSDGRIVTMTNRSFFLVNTDPPLLTRFNADGSIDASFAPALSCAGNGVMHLAQRDRLVVAATPPFSPNDAGICVEVRNADGTPDATFGVQGVARVGVGSNAFVRDLFIDGSERIVLTGSLDVPLALRLTADGRPDPGFGAGGIAALSGSSGPAVAGDCQGRTVLAGLDSDGVAPLAVRMLPDGTTDPAFTGAARGAAAFGRQLFVRPDGRLLGIAAVSAAGGGRGILFQLQGDTPCSGSTAVEYYNAAWDAYFVTAYPQEIAALDGGAFNGAWTRTGESFNVWAEPTDVMSTTCRFESTAFGARSSHFYTPFAAECAIVATNPDWLLEGHAFFLQQAGSGAQCAIGTRPLYRAYNRGMGGAPNHRYTTRPSVLDQMISRGWIFEGDAATRVFACVPG